MTAFDAACPACQVFVNTANLNLHVRVADLALGAFNLERSYNSDDSQPGPFGPGWTFNLGETLVPDSDKKTWTWRRGAGRIDRFAPATDPGRFFTLTRAPEALSSSADGALRVGSRVFRADGRLLSLRQDDGRLVTLEYDASGRLTAARFLGRTLEFRYDGTRISSVADSTGRIVRYAYTAEGRLAAHTNPDGATVEYRYDEAGRLIAAGAFTIAYDPDPEFSAVSTVTLPDGAARRYETGRSPRQVRVTDGAGGVTAYTSTALGLTESIADPAGNLTTYTYDAAGRRTRAVNPSGETSRFDYDSAGNLTAFIDGSGSRWTAEYDAAGNLFRLADPRGNAWQFRYDAGQPIAAADPLGTPLAATRNPSGQIVSLTDGSGNRSAFQYDSDGLLTQWTNALGATWSYRYDGAARVASVTGPAGATLNAEYDQAGRLAALTAGDNRATLAPNVERDALQRTVKSTDSFGNEVQYAYDAAGRLAALSLPAGVIRYEYDRAGRLARVSDWSGNFALYRYDAAGAVTSIMVSGGPLVAAQYDAAHQLKSLVSTGPDGAVVAGYRYARDGAGNRTGVVSLEPLPGPLALPAGRVVYDGASRVISREDGHQFTYGPAGNLAAIDGPRPAALAWDAFGRLENFGNAAFRYDASGLRVERTSAGAARRYVYDASGRLLMETDGANVPVAWYIHGLGLLWKLDAQGRPYFYHFDGAGNVVAISTPASGVVNRYRYDPQGRLAAAEETVENLFRARGEAGWIDDGDGLLYGNGNYWHPEFRLALSGSPGLDPPRPAILPSLRGPSALFLEGRSAQ